MKKTLFLAIAISTLFIQFPSHAQNLFVQHLGKINVASTNGFNSLDLFYVTNASPKNDVMGIYWFAKPNSHQALATWSSNTVVDFGDKLFCFQQAPYEMFIFSGLTNVDNPVSENDILIHCKPIYEEAVYKHQDYPGLRRITPETLLPPQTFYSRPRDMGFHLQIIQTSVTSSNVTFVLLGQKDKEALLVFDKELNVIRAEPVIKPKY